MDTPLAAPFVQNPRQGGLKRHRIDFTTPPTSPPDLDLQIEALLKDESLPSHLRTVVSYLVEDRKQTQSLLKICRELTEEVRLLRSENAKLKQQSSVVSNDVSQDSAPPKSDSHEAPAKPTVHSSSLPYEEVERSRSIVIAGIAESNYPSSSARVIQDIQCVRDIMDFLSIDCYPVSVYRLGRYNRNYPRLIKVVLPASVFAKQMLRRAPRLKHFKAPGLYIRPSLPKAERERLRKEREARRNVDPASISNQPTLCTPSNVANIMDASDRCDARLATSSAMSN